MIVSGGSFAAIMVSSSVRTVWHTLLCVRELLPIPGPLEAGTARLEDARRRFVALWREGKRVQAVEVAERSGLPAIERMLELVLARYERIAFQKDLGAVHSCAHALGAVCDLHHGLANALMIDTVLAWNMEAVPAKFDELAHVCGVAGGGKAFVPWLRELKAAIGIEGPLSRHGVKVEQLPRLVEIASADICHQTNPRPCAAADFEALFKAAI